MMYAALCVFALGALVIVYIGALGALIEVLRIDSPHRVWAALAHISGLPFTVLAVAALITAPKRLRRALAEAPSVERWRRFALHSALTFGVSMSVAGGWAHELAHYYTHPTYFVSWCSVGVEGPWLHRLPAKSLNPSAAVKAAGGRTYFFGPHAFEKGKPETW